MGPPLAACSFEGLVDNRLKLTQLGLTIGHGVHLTPLVIHEHPRHKLGRLFINVHHDVCHKRLISLVEFTAQNHQFLRVGQLIGLN